jgi:hypothetical protein
MALRRSFTPSASAAIFRMSRVVRVGAQGICQAWPKAESGASRSVVTARAVSGT